MYRLEFGLHRVTITGPEAARMFNEDRDATGIPPFVCVNAAHLRSHTTAPTFIIDTQSNNTSATVQRLKSFGANVS